MGARSRASQETDKAAKPAVSTVIADDHFVLRSGLQSLIENDAKMCPAAVPGARPFRVVGQAENGIEAIAAVKKHQPELLILDVNMPLARGPEVVYDVKRWCPAARIAVFTGVTSSATLCQLIGDGVDGLFSKAAPDSELITNLPALVQGKTFVSPSVLALLEHGSKVAALTGRERQILNKLIIGQSNVDIAKSLFLTEKTVSNHRTRLMAKLDVHSMPELIAFAHGAGLLSAGDAN